MKLQDILFIIIFIISIIKGKTSYIALIALLCFIVAMPLFGLWKFFTAQRLIWYGYGFLLLGIIKQIYVQSKK